MQFTATLQKFENNKLWGHHIIVPEEVVSIFEGTDRRVICTINDTVEFHCALMPKGDGQYFINLNQTIRRQLHLDIGSTLHLKLIKDNSEYGLPMPEEMQALLDMDDEGKHYFHSLTKGKQRSLLYIIGKPKNSDTRLRKALVVIDYLKRVKGKLDFKELNEAFK